MDPPIEFYYAVRSPPSRAVWMVLEALGLEYNSNLIDLRKGEQKTTDFKKISYRQKVPAIKIGDFVLAESRAIATYLVNAYGEECGKQDLYPKDLKERAVVDQHLYISENIIEPMLSYSNLPGVLFRGEVDKPEKLDDAKKVLSNIEDLLSEHTYIVSDKFTLADIFYYVITGLLGVKDFDGWNEFPKVVAWRAKMAALPYHKKTCEEPLALMKATYEEHLKKNMEQQKSK